MYTVESIIKNKSPLQGEIVSIKGFLVADLDSAFIYDSKADIASKNSIKITDNIFIQTCMRNIPCYVGGAYIYYDDILINGTVNFDNETIMMSKVSYLNLQRNERTYEINF